MLKTHKRTLAIENTTDIYIGLNEISRLKLISLDLSEISRLKNNSTD